MTPRDTNNSADDEFGSSFMSELEFNKRHKKALKDADPMYKNKKIKGKDIIRCRVLADKIRDEQWSTLKIKKLWKRNPLFAKWWKRNIDTQPDEQRYYPSQFRGEYGEGK